MAYALEQIAQNLKAAREGKGLSQRALAQKAGLPQSHISKIENGAVDLRLSSLVELARVLDMEVALVPRKNLSAVRTIVRAPEDVALSQSSKSAAKELQKLYKSLSVLTHEHPTLKELAQIQRRARELWRFELPPDAVETIRETLKALRAFERNDDNVRLLKQSLNTIDELRNNLAHAQPPEAFEKRRRAYSLEDHNHG